MFACLHAPVRPVTRAASTDDDASVGELLRDRLLAAAREFSPRVEVAGLGTVLCDLSGVAKLFGDAPTIAAELRREAADRGIPVRVTVAGTRTAALLVAAARPGVTVIDPGEEAAALEPLPIRTLDALLYLEADRLEVGPKPPGRFYRASPMEEIARHRAASLRRATRSRAHAAVRDVIERHERLMATLERWGIRTLGALASLPAAELSARLGQEGPAWQRIARGDDIGPLVPTEAEERFEGSLALEWPIEGLEPLSFGTRPVARADCRASRTAGSRGRGAGRRAAAGVARDVHAAFATAVPYPGSARTADARVARSRHKPAPFGDRCRHGPDRADPRPCVAALVARPGASGARAGVNVDGTPHRVDGRASLRFSARARYVSSGRVRDAAVRVGPSRRCEDAGGDGLDPAFG